MKASLQVLVLLVIGCVGAAVTVAATVMQAKQAYETAAGLHAAGTICWCLSSVWWMMRYYGAKGGA